MACERSFSILKFNKNRMRSLLIQEKLEAFMLMASERDILNCLSIYEMILEVISKSPSLKKLLTYQYIVCV